MRLIAERLLPPELRGATYMQGELAQRRSMLPAPSAGHVHHLYCSRHNEGAAELVSEVERERCLDGALKTTPSGAELPGCEAMLLYLHGLTWTSGEASAVLAEEVARALYSKRRLVLAHEMPGAGQEERHPVEFSSFFDETPAEVWRGAVGRARVPRPAHALPPTPTLSRVCPSSVARLSLAAARGCRHLPDDRRTAQG